MWKLLFQSVAGSSHLTSGKPCQDSCRVRLRRSTGQSLLVLTCADGAGSAAHAAEGARLACQTITKIVHAELSDYASVQEVCRHRVLDWFGATRHSLEQHADKLGVEARQLASTLLLAVVGETAAVFCQIGDGAIVVRRDGQFLPVFWPQTGEYANTTNFLTDPDLAEHLDFETYSERIDELALFTDGIQRLALNYGSRTVHAPFFESMFRVLRAVPNPGKLQKALREYLVSDAVNQRTDDDKTVILATRVPLREQSAPSL